DDVRPNLMGSPSGLRQNTVAQQTLDCVRRLAGDLPGTGSKACARGVPDAIKGRYAAHCCRRNLQGSYALRQKLLCATA
ncbi:hypothetical protein, partial [Pseudomonas viridiflava]|uniref:hypothetical protein n=1 Tax=Pseudomonas viridiflava TaxID=33069 RepID=UPI0019D0E1E5